MTAASSPVYRMLPPKSSGQTQGRLHVTTPVTRELFETAPRPPRGKPAHIWQGVVKRSPDVLAVSPPDMKKRPWLYRCPAYMCFYQLSFSSEKDAQTGAEKHQANGCPWFGGGTTTLSWGIMSDSFIAPIWRLLDECMDSIMAQPATIEESNRQIQARIEARAYANTLALLMPPFFHHPDEIAREAKVRYEKRKAGEDYETHGMGRLRFKPPNTNLDSIGRVVQKGPQLDEATIKGIKAALDSKLFQPEQLAATYAVPVSYIKSLA